MRARTRLTVTSTNTAPMHPIRPSTMRLLACAVILAGVLSGCATYRSCGFSGCPGDAQITADIQALIRQHPAIEAPNSVRVSTIDQVVYLYGQVDTEGERETAESLAREVAGVRRVVDSINFSYEGR
jgi:osmotically-inducible protein OsmY